MRERTDIDISIQFEKKRHNFSLAIVRCIVEGISSIHQLTIHIKPRLVRGRGRIDIIYNYQ